MKMKTSITLSDDLVESIDRQRGTRESRSEFIEGALRSYIAQQIRAEQNARDLELLNRNAADLNREAADVLEYQRIP
jgi:metal-responsive CopG/Arc/MetJ family transcriptional regulator